MEIARTLLKISTRMQDKSIHFRPLTSHDLPLIHSWLNQAHVKQWWDNSGEYAEIEAEFLPLTQANASTRGFLALLQDQPFGFIQVYTVKGSGDGWWENETDAGARGIDQFIGEASLLNQGLGTLMVKAFTELLFQDPAVSKIQTDPSPTNARAIRCYTKAGFIPQREVMTPDGLALLMLKTR